MATMQGNYISDETTKYLEIPFDVNWFSIRNITQMAAAVGGAGQMTSAFWQQDEAYGTGILKEATIDASVTTDLDATNGFVKIDTSQSPLGTMEVHTGITNAAPPVMTVADALLYPTGSIVRLGLATGSTTIQNLDFTVHYNAPTSIRLEYMIAPGAASTGGNVFPLKWDGPWYPRNRTICSITQAAQAVIGMTVTHEFEVGDIVRLMVPVEFGMVEANGKEVKITAINRDITTPVNTITVDLDTTTYTAFAWPATGTILFSTPEVIPLSGPIINTAYRGIKIVPGAANPGGVAGDVMYWIAGDSFGI